MSPRLTRLEEVPGVFALDLPDLAATEGFAASLAPWLSSGDVIALCGDLGAGKTAFTRALLRALAADPALEVPSPTFSLLVSYELGRGKVIHADLYRIMEPEELDEIGWDELADDALLIVEWPERAEGRLPADRLTIAFEHASDLGPEGRRAAVAGTGALAGRLERLFFAQHLVDAAGFAGAEWHYMQGDASSRSYARLVLPGRSAVLMNAPTRSDGPPVKRGLPYSRIAHLAEDVRAFVAMAEALRAEGFSAPEIYAADLQNGLLLTEDLGQAGVLEGSPPAPVRERYEAAMEVLAALHGRNLPGTLPVTETESYDLPIYDTDAFLIELELMLDWYLPHRNVLVDQVVSDEFAMLWRNALAPARLEPRTWVLRDYHSPNLIWLPDRPGMEKVGLIDFQDAVLGPAAYDVVSLTQDARVDVSEGLELHLLGLYVKRRREADPTFDARAFAHLYALMGAQRATKILGIFARLNQRDGKPQYLRHLPRIRRYLARCLGHQELGSLKAWYEAVLPPRDLST